VRRFEANRVGLALPGGSRRVSAFVSESRQRICFVLPTHWDRRQLEHCRGRWAERFEIVWGEPSDWDCPWDLDLVAYVDHMTARLRGRISGVTSSSDYPGAVVAGAIATRLGLAGTEPRTLVACAHKYQARLVQQRVAPEATPGFALLDGHAARTGECAIGFPCFVKPVKSAYSVLARRLEDAAALRRFLAQPAVAEFCRYYLHLFKQMLELYSDVPADGRLFLAETVLHGSQVTVEGWQAHGAVHVLGISDSEVDPETGSFRRFVFPSHVAAPVQERMRELAGRVVEALGLRETFFNIEMMYDAATDHIGIIEINPRLCGQFGDLYEKVLGVHSYEMALELAAAGRPRLPAGAGTYAVAASVPLRLFAPARVERVPTVRELEAAEALFPGTLIWNECEAGQELADFDRIEDGMSCRYAVINLGAADRESLEARLGTVREHLPYRFAPL